MKISVIGAGYVGLVSAVCLAELGHFINLIELEKQKVEVINSGRTPIHENGLHPLLAAHIGRNLRVTTGYDGIPYSDISLICVGTPPYPDGGANLSMVEASSRSIGKALREREGYHIVAVKSTIPPRTTQDLIMPTVLEQSGKSLDDIGFVVNPEFLREGLAVQDFMAPDRIVIGSSDRRAGELYKQVYNGMNTPVVRTGLIAAEMIKYASNSILATKISFSNEIGNICKKLGVDVYEVMHGVGLDHRISPHFLNAGAGFGGSCFPKDVAALIHLAEAIGEDPKLLKSVLRVNDRQPLIMIELLENRVGDLGGKRIAVLGLAFKNDTDDIRESRSINVILELKRRGAFVVGYDPIANESMRSLIPDIEYCENPSDTLRGADACLIMTEWPQFANLNSEFGLMRSRVIIEGKRVLSCRGSEGICW